VYIKRLPQTVDSDQNNIRSVEHEKLSERDDAVWRYPVSNPVELPAILTKVFFMFPSDTLGQGRGTCLK